MVTVSMFCSLLPSSGDLMPRPSNYQRAKTGLQSTCIHLRHLLRSSSVNICSSEILAGDVSESSGSSWSRNQTSARCLQFIPKPLPLLEYFTHLSKQINWVQTDVRGANCTVMGQCILLPDTSLCVCVCVCPSQANHGDSFIACWLQQKEAF